MEDIVNGDSLIDLPKDFKSYSEYLSFCQSNGVTNYLSESEWADRDNPKLKFVNVPGFTAAAGGFVLRNSGKIIDSMSKGGAKAAATAAFDALKSEGISNAKDFILKVGIDNGTGKGGSGNSGETSGYGGSTDGPASLRGTYETNPYTIDLRPGLTASVYSDTVNYPSSRACFSHITGFKFGFDQLDVPTKFYFDNVLVPMLQNRAQMMVNFRVDMNILTTEKLSAYFNSVITALSLYYFMTAIISYTNVPTNKDRGTVALRNMITAQDIDLLTQLRDMLSVFPIPPNINNLAFWLYQTFTDGPNAQTIIRFMPVSFDATASDNNAIGFTNSSTVLTDVMTSLNTRDNIDISSMLTRIAPNWLMPNIMSASPFPVYSASFSTLFANAGHCYSYSGSQYYGPNITTDIATVNYFSLDPVLDGMVLGLQTLFNSAIANFRPGLGKVVNTLVVDNGTKLANRWSYTYSTTNNNYHWRLSNISIESAYGRPEVAKAYLSASYYSLIPNSIVVRGVNAEIIRESTKAICSWLLTLDSLKSQKQKKSNSKSKFNKDKVDGDKSDS